MQVCYVVTSSGNDGYAEMAYIAARMLRDLHPDVKRVVLSDEVTAKNLKAANARVLSVIDELVTVETGHDKASTRSRFVKTSMRNALTGDFVFLDVDALPIKPLDGLFNLSCDFAVALDRNQPPSKYKLAGWIRRKYEELGWSYDAPNYYNSGVIFFRDSPTARRLGEEWHNKWKQMVAAGPHQDQPSLNAALHTLGMKPHLLPNEFNAQLGWSKWNARNGRVMHFFTVNAKAEEDTVLASLVKTLQEKGELDQKLIDELRRTGYPWVHRDWIGGQLAVGRYGQVLKLVLKRAMGQKPAARPAKRPQNAEVEA